jgi:hypothetical protein
VPSLWKRANVVPIQKKPVPRVKFTRRLKTDLSNADLKQSARVTIGWPTDLGEDSEQVRFASVRCIERSIKQVDFCSFIAAVY